MDFLTKFASSQVLSLESRVPIGNLTTERYLTSHIRM